MTPGVPGLDFSQLPLGSLYDERLAEEVVLLYQVVQACQCGDEQRLCELGLAAPANGHDAGTGTGTGTGTDTGTDTGTG